MRLEAEDLAFGYPERRVGHGVNLAVSPGEVLCLLGPNGCGKTTLFKTLLGLLRPQGGCVLLDGEDISGLPRAEIARGVAYVPQAHGATFPYTVRDFVLMGRISHRGLFASATAEDRDLAQAALGRLGIAELAPREVTRLSGGQRQLVIIARAIAQAAPLIVMDEPTASLDFGNQAVVLAIVRHLARSGTGIVLSTHDPDHALAVATRVALMRDGQLIAHGAAADVLTPALLAEVYGISVTMERLASGAMVCVPHYEWGEEHKAR